MAQPEAAINIPAPGVFSNTRHVEIAWLASFFSTCSIPGFTADKVIGL